MTSVEEGESLFDWSIFIKQLDKCNVRGANTLREKQLTVVGYFFEMGYDICLAPGRNVSNNPGFESILGVFDNIKSVAVQVRTKTVVVVIIIYKVR